MKTVTKYVAFDGSEFDLKSDCEEYEKEGYEQEIVRLGIRLQQLKSGELASEYKRYVNSKHRYLASCTTKMSPQVRAAVLNNYATMKARYEETVKYYNSTKRKMNLLKERRDAAISNTNKESL
jgi:hypothetical protein